MPRTVSNARKALTGTARAGRKTNGDTAARLTRVPPPPAHLSAAAKAAYRRLAPLAVRSGKVSELDVPALALLATLQADVDQLEAVIEREGMTIPGAQGGRKSHPAVAERARARNQLHRLFVDFGMVPRSRGSVDAAPSAESFDDPADEFF